MIYWFRAHMKVGKCGQNCGLPIMTHVLSIRIRISDLVYYVVWTICFTALILFPWM